jgi:NAD(P)-dependent dehydrogenase (short-subunit alcohol dehydrogenase family)
MLQPLAGQTALITGAGKRIGQATALALAREGVGVVVHYHTSRDEAEALADTVRDANGRAWTVAADLADPDACANLLPRALALTGGALDLLVNNASIFPLDRLADVSWPSLQQNLAVNAWAPFVLGRAFHARVGRGCIVNLLDARLQGYDWTHVGYIVSKHALAVLTRMTALEYAPHMRVNGVAPGLILPPPGKDERYLDALVHTVPLLRHGDADDVARAVVFLAANDFINGEVIHVDGGRHLREFFGGQNPD